MKNITPFFNVLMRDQLGESFAAHLANLVACGWPDLTTPQQQAFHSLLIACSRPDNRHQIDQVLATAEQISFDFKPDDLDDLAQLADPLD